MVKEPSKDDADTPGMSLKTTQKLHFLNVWTSLNGDVDCVSKRLGVDPRQTKRWLKEFGVCGEPCQIENNDK